MSGSEALAKTVEMEGKQETPVGSTSNGPILKVQKQEDGPPKITFEIPDDFKGGNREIRVKFYCGLEEVDDQGGTFSCSGQIIWSWAEPGMPDMETLTWETIEPVSPFQPSLLMLDQSDLKVEEPTIYSTGGRILVCCPFSGTFYTSFLLQRFPFDRQILLLKLQNIQEWSELTFTQMSDTEEYYGLTNQVYITPKVMLTWEHSPGSVTVYHDHSGEEPFPYPALGFRLTRKPAYYLSNVAVPVFLLTLFCMSVFFFDTTDLGGRLSVVLSLILTSVAFKYVIAGYLPKVPYATLLDKYVMWSFCTLFAVGIENCFISVSAVGDSTTQADRICAYVATAIAASSIIVMWSGNILYPTWEKVVAGKDLLEKELQATTFELMCPVDNKFPIVNHQF